MADNNDEHPQAELIAYLDGELDAQTASDVEARLESEPALRREADALKRTWNLLDFLPQPEPSQKFTERTLEKLSIPTPMADGVERETAAFSGGAAVGPARVWVKWLAYSTALAVVFALGYSLPGPFFSRSPQPLSDAEAEAQMAADLRVIDQLSLYQRADNLELVRGLSHPELFGTSSEEDGRE